VGEAAAGRPQPRHEYLYWEVNDWTAIRQDNWRAVKPPKNAPWQLYELGTDPSESRDVAAEKPDVLSRLVDLAAKAHEPVRPGTFSDRDRHERDRRAKFGKHDDPNDPATPKGAKRKTRR